MANVKQEKNIEKVMESLADVETEFEKTPQPAQESLQPQEPEVQDDAEAGSAAGHEDQPDMVNLEKSIADMWIPSEFESSDQKDDLDEMFGEMQLAKTVATMRSLAVRFFITEATRAMKKHLLRTVPGMDKGYARLVIFCFPNSHCTNMATNK